MLAAHFDAARPMANPYGQRGLVDLLAARPGTANKAFFDVLDPDAQRGEPRHDRIGQVHRYVCPIQPRGPLACDLFRVGYSAATCIAGQGFRETLLQSPSQRIRGAYPAIHYPLMVID